MPNTGASLGAVLKSVCPWSPLSLGSRATKVSQDLFWGWGVVHWEAVSMWDLPALH